MMARAKTILLIAVLVCAGAGASAAPVTLMAHWTFDDFTTATQSGLVDQVGSLTSDYVTTDMNTTGSPPTISVPNFTYDFGKAIWLDRVNDYIRIPDHPNLNVGANSFSLSFWIKSERHSTSSLHLFNKGSVHQGPSTGTQLLTKRHHYGLKYNNSALYFACDDSALQEADPSKRDNGAKKEGNSDRSTTPGLPILNNQWHHIVLVRDATVTDGLSSGVQRLYIDGVEELLATPVPANTGTFPRHFAYSGLQNGNLDEPGSHFNIGRAFNAYDDPYENFGGPCAIDDLRLYRGAMTLQDVYYIYNPTPTPIPAKAERWEIYE